MEDFKIEYFEEEVAIPAWFRESKYRAAIEGLAESDNKSLVFTNFTDKKASTVAASVRSYLNRYHPGWCIYKRSNKVYVIKA